MDQIQNALKTVVERMAQKSQYNKEDWVADDETHRMSAGTKYTKSTL